MTTFTELGLPAPILKALAAEGYETPTPIQAQAIPHLLTGSDLLGVAQTGTGKTAAFALPMLTHLNKINRQAGPRACRALVLAPTRELASQIEASFKSYGKFMRLNSTVIFGGVPINRQIRAVANGIDVVVATPGRLLDLLDQRAIVLSEIELFVLDEADRMLDMGFIRDIRRILTKLPARRQTMFFSATMPKEIADLAGAMLTNPVQVAVTPVASTVDRIEQHIMFCPTKQKQAVLHKLLDDAAIKRAVVFSRTKHGADRIVKQLAAANIPADAIHGNKSQNQRERAMAAFRSGQSRLLIATDIAARGIDVDGITHVINFDLPNIAESYVHRIGRTARAGAEGAAISLVADDERGDLRAIERLIRRKIDILPLPEGLPVVPVVAERERPEQPRGQRQGRRPGFGQNDRAQGNGRPAQGAPARTGTTQAAPARRDERRPATAGGDGPTPGWIARPSRPAGRSARRAAAGRRTKRRAVKHAAASRPEKVAAGPCVPPFASPKILSMVETVVTIRGARAEDAEEIAAVHDAAWRDAYRGIIPGRELERMVARRGPRWWHRAIAQGTRLTVLDYDESIAGYTSYGRNRVPSLPFGGEIFELYLAPEFQGIGFGRRLFDAARRDLANYGLRSTLVWALADNDRALAFYERLGGRVVRRAEERFGADARGRIAFGFD